MRTLSLALSTLALLAAGCASSDERTLFLRSGTADIPILVQGPQDSSTLVVFVHGGPGGSSILYEAAMPAAFARISEQYLLASYDQRAAGAAQGNTPASELTIAQHEEDLDEVLALLRAEYPKATKVFLLGHSWGGTLTSQYLLTPAQAAHVTGWIDVNGATDFPRVLELSRAWAMEKARAKVDAGGEGVQRWQDALAWYEAHPSLDKDTLPQHFSYVDGLKGTTYDPSKAIGDRWGPLFFSGYSAGAELNNAGMTQPAMAEELLAFNSHPKLGTVTVPTLFLHGAHDGRVPIQVGEEAMAALGTAAEHKTFVRFEASAHRPFDEEPEKFSQSILDFLQRYR